MNKRLWLATPYLLFLGAPHGETRHILLPWHLVQLFNHDIFLAVSIHSHS